MSVLTALKAASVSMPVSYNDYLFICERVLDDLSLNSRIFINTSGYGPGPMMVYFMVLLLSHVRRVGLLSGALQYIVPAYDPTWVVPLPIAKFLEGLGKYTEDGADASSAIELTADITATTAPYGTSYPLTAADFPRDATKMTFQNWYPFVSSASGELQATTAAITSVAMSSAAPNVWKRMSADLLSTGFGVTRMSEIPLVAPDASAYARAFDDSTNTFTAPALSTATLSWRCSFRKFNVEAAMLFSSYQALSGAYQLPIDPRNKMIPCYDEGPEYMLNGTTETSMITSNNVPHAVFTNLWHRTNSFKAGPILRTTTFCGARVRTLQPAFHDINMNNFNTAIIECYMAVMDSYAATKFAAGSYDPLGRNLVVFWAVCQMALQLRYNKTCLLHNQMTFKVGNSTGCAQSFYVDGTIGGLQLPPLIAEFIGSIGPVLNQGQVIYPALKVGQRDTLGYAGATGLNSVLFAFRAWQLPSGSGTLPAVGAVGQLDVQPIDGLLGSYPVLDFVLGTLFLSNQSMIMATTTYWSDLVTATLGDTAMQYPVDLLEDVIALYVEMFNQGSSGATLANNLIHVHADPCGTLDGMLAYTVFSTYRQYAFPPANLATKYLNGQQWVQKKVCRPTQLSAQVALATEEAVRALALGVFSQASLVNQLSNVGKYTYRPDTVALATLRNFNNRTFSVGCAFGESLAVRQAKYKPDVVKLGGQTFANSKSHSGDGCWIKDALREVWRTFAPAIATAAGPVISSLAPPGLQGLAHAATNLAVNTARSHLDIKAAGFDTTTRAARKEVSKLGPSPGPPPAAVVTTADVQRIVVEALKAHNPPRSKGKSSQPKKPKKQVGVKPKPKVRRQRRPVSGSK